MSKQRFSKAVATILIGAALVSAAPATASGPGAGPGPGARSLSEKDANLDIARRVSSALRSAGVTTVMTRWADATLTPAQRVWVANRFGADAFVSLHNNASPNRAAAHGEVYHQIAGGRSKALAEAVAAQLPRATGEPAQVKSRRGDHGDYYWQLRMNHVPSVIVESAFVSNRRQAWLLATSPSYRQAIARAVADGILEWQRALGATPPEIDEPAVRAPAGALDAPQAADAAVRGRYAVSLSWTASAQATAYHVRRDGRLIAVLENPAGAELPAVLSGGTAPMTFTDRWAAPGQTYTYEITAARAAGPASLESPPASVQARTPAITVCLDAGHGGADPGALGGW